jgi:L-ribulose-5-phosphate 4-epimerase
MLLAMKKAVCAANLELVARGLVVETWGNASAIDRASGLVVIKPSGVPYARLKASEMVVVSLETGRVVEGRCNPSSDTPTHLALYRAFAGIGGVVHTHSVQATAWAQARKPIPALGTTHADYFRGPIPCTRALERREIEVDYEANTGRVIVEAFGDRDPLECPAILVDRHGPFVWGRTVEVAVENAVVLEYLALLASVTLQLAPKVGPMPASLLNKHFFRKHGPGAYYGQTSTVEHRETSKQS